MPQIFLYSGMDKSLLWNTCDSTQQTTHTKKKYIYIIYIIYIYIQGVSVGTVNILGGGNMDYSK